jgi:hypothetical protein
LYFVVRRAVLEDQAALLSRSPGSFDLSELDAADLLAFARTLTGGDDKVRKQMLDLDDRLGLNPRAFAALRWRIVDDATTPAAKVEGRRDRLRVVGE